MSQNFGNGSGVVSDSGGSVVGDGGGGGVVGHVSGGGVVGDVGGSSVVDGGSSYNLGSWLVMTYDALGGDRRGWGVVDGGGSQKASLGNRHESAESYYLENKKNMFKMCSSLK